jgi:hypothetical protein
LGRYVLFFGKTRRDIMNLLARKIQYVFDDARDQAEALVKIYQLFVPNFEGIERLEGSPACGMILHRFIFEKFVAFDCIHHPGNLAGGLWMNKGFSEDLTLLNWEVNLDNCRVRLREELECFN